MSEKRTLTVVFEIEHSGGPRLESYEALAEFVAGEWEGMEVYFQDGGQDDETSVKLYVSSAETN